MADRKLALLSLVAMLGGCEAGRGPGAVSAPVADTSTVVMTSDPTAALVPTGPSTGCRTASTRYPWGVLASRSWTPLGTTPADRPNEAPGTAYGTPFNARLVLAYGADSDHSNRTVELELADGCRRRFRTASLSAEDNAVIDAEEAKHPLAADPATYAIDWQPDRATPAALNAGTLGKYETQHFVLWFGKNAAGASYRWAAGRNLPWATFLDGAGTWMERVWAMNNTLLGAPMPYTGSTDRKKANIYICGTGLPFLDHPDLEDCGASAADAGWVSAPNLEAGHTTLIHEFGHMIQFYTGGFRDKGDAGPIWETGAEWNSYELSPTYGGFLMDYVNNLENGPLWSHARYGAHPFIGYLYHADRTHDLVWKAWTDNLRTPAGATTEDFLQAIVRLGQAAGRYPNGFASFADDMGWYGAQLAGMDFVDRRALIDATTASATETWASHLYAPLALGPKRGQYVSSRERPLLEFGTHVIPLTVSAGRVQVTVTGATTANAAAWRFAIVAIRGNDSPTYSALGAVSGKGSTTIARAVYPDARVFLVVTATPGIYETLGWQAAGPVQGTKFPYNVTMSGATPSTVPAAPCAANAAPGAWNLNYATNGNLEGGKPC